MIDRSLYPGVHNLRRSPPPTASWALWAQCERPVATHSVGAVEAEECGLDASDINWETASVAEALAATLVHNIRHGPFEPGAMVVFRSYPIV